VPRIASLVFLLALTACSSGTSMHRLTFTEGTTQVELLSTGLWPHPWKDGVRVPDGLGAPWHGLIPRRLPADPPAATTAHGVPFVVDYTGGVAARAWVDLDLDDDLRDETPVALVHDDARPGRRAFLAPLRWSAPHEGQSVPVRRDLRVVLEPMDGPDPSLASDPRYAVQDLSAPRGRFVLEGRPHRAFLLDGDADGFYTPSLLDGLFVDLDDDGQIVVDQMGDEYGSFSVPFVMGGSRWQTVTVSPAGTAVTLRRLGAAGPPAAPPVIGQAAPEFAITDLTGRPLSLSSLRGRWVFLYFWASWCRTCEGQAEAIARIHERLGPRGVEIVGVSYDTDAGAMASFRARHGHRWPTSFTGRMLWEDPVGRLFRMRGSGVGYLIDPSGSIEGRYSDIPRLESRLESLLGTG
jgi:thiol-disulfide isomerase/thioredoxin